MVVWVNNERARFDYELLDKYEAGLVLRGFEVKAIKAGRAKLAGSHVIVRGAEALLVGAEIGPYQAKNTPSDYQPGRNLKLLLTTKEIGQLAGAGRQAGLTIIPLSLYNKNGQVKLSLALARGKKKYDKREALRKREAKRLIERTLKRNGDDRL